MSRIIFGLILSFSFGLQLQAKEPQALKAKTLEVVNWTSAQGVARLETSRFKGDFFPLANNFESQINKAFCGPATAAIVLNALRVRRHKLNIPTDPTLLQKQDMKYLPISDKWTPFYERYTQHNLFIEGVKPKIAVLGQPDPKTRKKDFGLQLHQLAKFFETHKINVKKRSVNKSLKPQTIRQEIIKTLSTKDQYVIVNYARKVMDQPGGGHISPLGAYHKASDSVLILDVTPNKADWVWVTMDRLIAAMNTPDTIENRGYLLVSDRLIDGAIKK